MTDRDSPPLSAATADVRSAPAAEPLSRGTPVGRYVLIGPIGAAGAAGVVYSAYDPTLDRQIAIKLLDAGEGSRERVLAEAQALARLSHPNVVAVHDVGTFRQHVFIAMERVEGERLLEWLASRPRTARETLSALLAAGEALEAAHRAGLVHAHFDPDHVLVGNDGRVRVLDFGVARERSDAPDTRFLAPEQQAGGAPDPRSDQFSFCASAYRALYGTLPFAGATDEEYLEGVRAGRVVEAPAGSRVPRYVRPLLVRGLSPAPAERHASMAELLAQLRIDPARRRRRRLRAAAMVMLGVALVAALVLVQRRQMRLCGSANRNLVGAWDEPRRLAIRAAFRATGAPYADAVLHTVEQTIDRYTRDWVAMSTDACEATQVRRIETPEVLDLRMSCLADELTQLKTVGELFSRADAALVERAVQMAQSLPPIDRCANVAALRAPRPPPADRQTRQRIRDVQHDLAEIGALDLAAHYDEGIRRATAAVASAATLGYPPVEAEAQLMLGRLQVDRGDFGPALAPLTRALAAAWASRHDEVAAHATIQLVFATVGQQHYEEADRWVDLAEASLRRLSTHHPLVGELYHARSVLRREEGRGDDALADARRAVESDLGVLGPDHHDVALAYRALGQAYYEKAAYADALDALGKAVAIDEKTLGPEHPELVPLWVAMANVYSDTGDSTHAQSFYQRGLKIYQRVNPNHPELASIYSNMGDDFESQGKLHEALDCYEHGFAVAKRTRGDSRSTAVAEIHLGSVETALGHAAEAVPRLEDALSIAERVLGREHFVYGRGLYKLAAAHQRLSRFDLAESEYQRSVAILEKALGSNHPELALPLVGLADLYASDLRQPKRAIAPLDRAAGIYASLGAPYTGELASVRFTLSQATWAAGDHRRALALADQAKTGFTAAGNRAALAKLDAWLARHR